LEVVAGPERKPFTDGSGRLELARAIASRDNPLTARVMVNRIWQHHFGKPIVPTPSDFGLRGTPPSHPELLEWLAADFQASGWSIKAMHRLLLSSEAYRLSSVPTREALEKDPDNRLLGRQNRRRLEAEPFHDALLAVAGTLDSSRGGPADTDPASRRRMVYLRVSRTSRSPFEAMFDGADPTAHTDRRTVSTVAPQALFLINHPFVREVAVATASRLRSWEPQDARARVGRAYALLYGRPAAPEEVSRALEHLKGTGGVGDEGAWTEFVRVLLCANEFVTLD
jgi:hypothetical protein